MQKLLITLGLGIAAIGVLYPYLRQLGLGQLPGDIILKGENSTVYFPVVSLLSLVCWFRLCLISSDPPNVSQKTHSY